MSIKRLGNNSNFASAAVSKSTRQQKAGAAQSAGPASKANAASAASKNQDTVSISPLVGNSGAAAQVSLVESNETLPDNASISALKGAASALPADARQEQALQAMASQLVDRFFTAA